MRSLRQAAIGATTAAWLAAGAAWGAETPKVVVTIKPIHALAAAVMKGVAEPRLLIRGGGSPHAYALKPSDAEALQDADMVVRVSERLEVFLNRAIVNLAGDAVIVTVEDAPGVIHHTARQGGVWETHSHAAHDGRKHGKDARKPRHDHDHDHHAHGGRDPHLWLDPANAAAITAEIARRLAAKYPAHAAAFQSNARDLDARLTRLDGEIRAASADLRGRPYIVFHDAYRYFEERYRLSPAGAITVSPERPPGARRLAAIRKRIRSAQIACVFAEPQFEPRLIATIIADTGARAGALDPLGATLPAGEELYFTLLRNLAAGFRACLAPVTQK